MNYSVSNTINQPLDLVIEKFKDPNAMLKWMPGLERVEHIEGTPGQVGGKSDLHFLHKNKPMVITETVLEENLPQSIKFSYQSKMGYNEVEIAFEQLSENAVKQTNHSFFDFKGFMKLLAPLMKGMFKKQSLTYLDAFKDYAEK